MKNKIFTIGVTALLIFSGGAVMSQPPPPPPPPDSSSAPIDSGDVALLLAVGCFGYFQLKKKGAV